MVWSMSKGKIDSGNVLELVQGHFMRITKQALWCPIDFSTISNQFTSQYFSFEDMSLFATLKKLCSIQQPERF